MTRSLIAIAVLMGFSLAVDSAIAQRPNGQRNALRRPDNGLKAGERAPTFKLQSPDGESETDLKSLLREKPVVLIFGSYT